MKKLNLKRKDKKKLVWAGILILLAVSKDLICSLLPEGSRADFLDQVRYNCSNGNRLRDYH